MTATATPGRTRGLGALGLFAGVLAFPFLPFIPFSVVGVSVEAAQYTIVAVSLVLLVGWVGQISLGHAALVGVGAYATGWATAALDLSFPLGTLFAGFASAAFATILGGVALRVRGLYLAVATLIFSWMADAFLFRIEWVIRHSSIDLPVIGNPDGVPRFDLSDRPTMFYISWGVALGVVLLVSNLKRSKTGRAFFAVRGSEIGAASLGIDVTRYKLLAFTLSGFLAGIAGSLAMLDSRSISTDQFRFTFSLFYLAVAVVGGLASLGGAFASSLLFSGLNEVFFRVRWLGDALDLVSACLLGFVLLLYRGGLAAVPDSLGRWWRMTAARVPRGIAERAKSVSSGAKTFGETLRSRASALAAAAQQRVAVRISRTSAQNTIRYVLRRPDLAVAVEAGASRRVAEAESAPSASTGDKRALESTARHGTDAEAVVSLTDHVDIDGARRELAVVLPTDRADRKPVLEATGIVVRFGGLTAVNDASLVVREHEIVGLIGPNGAGKTTLFNAIAGLNSPAEGTVHLLGEDVTRLPVHRRAEKGVARTFQAIQLFPQLSVFENLLVATHVHNPTGFLRHSVAAESSLRSESELRSRVQEVVDDFGLLEVADRKVGGLPFGVLRMVEVARALVTGFPLIMLDEPASGLDNNETDRLSRMLLEVRARGVTLLLIEHDVRMVTTISDYIYVINRGEIICDGPPDVVRNDDTVVQAYLGRTEEPDNQERLEVGQ